MPAYNLSEESNFNIVKLTKEVGFGSLSNHFLQRSRREGADFNLLIIGAAGSGKSTLLANLYNQEILAADRRRITRQPNSIEFVEHESVVEEAGVALRLKVTEVLGYGELSFSAGGQAQIHKEKIQKILKNVEEKHRNHFDNENYAQRSQKNHLNHEKESSNARNQLYHAAVVFIQPQRNLAISSSDAALLNALQSRVNVIPVIAKADCYIAEELQRIKANLKQALNDSKILLFPNITDVSDDDWVIREAVDVRSHCPFITIASLPDQANAGARFRKYPWGVVSVDAPIPRSNAKPTNASHSLSLGAMTRILELSECCGNDLFPMQRMLIRSHFEFLKRHTVEKLYENFRTEIVSHVPAAPVAPMRLNKSRETLKIEQEFVKEHQELEVKSQEKVSKAHKQGLKVHEQTSKPNEQAAKPQEQVTKPNEQVTKPSEQVTKPSEQVTKPLEQASNQHEQEAKPQEHHDQSNNPQDHHKLLDPSHEQHQSSEALDEESLFPITALEPIREEEEPVIVDLDSSLNAIKNKKNNKKQHQLGKDLLMKKESSDRLKESHDDLVSPIPIIQK